MLGYAPRQRGVPLKSLLNAAYVHKEGATICRSVGAGLGWRPYLGSGDNYRCVVGTLPVITPLLAEIRYFRSVCCPAPPATPCPRPGYQGPSGHLPTPDLLLGDLTALIGPF
ncbi:hypothetical protein AAFF_G00120800 [Aldrovandia affinis]|uniref:Uncharacterized protein n=1 Tax=Aldrovandia affinis TaxID=143900 RepID=A0AAD7RS82_9TELE|nr:hypothetical protein AAFF_G00120800 [Aldrovandia affinis]